VDRRRRAGVGEHGQSVRPFLYHKAGWFRYRPCTQPPDCRGARRESHTGKQNSRAGMSCSASTSSIIVASSSWRSIFARDSPTKKSRSADKVAFPFMGFTSPKSEHKYPVYWRFVRADAFIRPLQDKSSVAQRFHTKDERSRLPKSGKTRLNTFSPVVVFTQMK